MAAAFLGIGMRSGAQVVVEPSGATVAGKTIAEWSTNWWQWAVGLSSPGDPFTDTTGQFANVKQSGPVFFLAGSIGGTSSRQFEVPANTYVLVPLLAGEWSQLELGFDKTAAQIRQSAQQQANQIDSLHATLDGVTIPLASLFAHREASPDFNFIAVAGNQEGVPAGSSGIAVADGYFLMLAPMTPGIHVLNYGGGVSGLSLFLNETDTITVIPPRAVVFSDNFDMDTSANWAVNPSSPDSLVTFNYDYSADGIPAATHSQGGTTRGVKFEANLSGGVPAAVSISPIGQSFSGDHRLRFDMWLNVVGPFPGGGVGSTEHITAGVGTTGNHVQWTGAGNNSDGFWFAVDGEGGSSDIITTTLPDFSALSGGTLHPAASGIYQAGTVSNSRGSGNTYYRGDFPGGQTAPLLQGQSTNGLAVGTVGFAWRDVIISKEGNTVTWSIDGLKIATIGGVSFTGSNVFVGYWDFFASIAANRAFSFGLVDNVRVEAVTLPAVPLAIELINDAAVLTWSSPAFSLQAAPTVAGVYTNVPGATSPHTNSFSGPQQFFRLRSN